MQNFKSIIQQEKLTLVDFYATWCGPCRTMHPILEKLRTMVNDRATILKIDIDDPENALTVSEYNIMSVPTLIIFSKGKVLWRGSGVVSAEHLSELLSKFQPQEVTQ